MKKIVCEMCEGSEFLKQDGMFVCQGCGMKYSAEEAKKIMVEDDTAPVVSSAQDDMQVDNLLKLAKSSFESKNYAQAENFCNQVISMDANNYEAWKLKGEAINYQINANNPRILEVFNCIMTAYRVLDDDGKEENKYDVLDAIKTCFEGEIDFWLDQLEAQRPTTAAVAKAKNTFSDSLDKVTEAFEEMGFDTAEGYKKNLMNYFIGAVNTKCVSLWKTTVGYNYYRESFNTNNHTIDCSYEFYASWTDESYRPAENTRATFVEECDNLIDLLEFAAGFFNDQTAESSVKTVYENAIWLNSHAMFSRSYKRMVSTTTNGYGAVTDRREYWDNDRSLTFEAKNLRRARNNEFKEKIIERVPSYTKILEKKAS